MDSTGNIVSDRSYQSSPSGGIGTRHRTIIQASEITPKVIFPNAKKGRRYWIRQDCQSGACWSNGASLFYDADGPPVPFNISGGTYANLVIGKFAIREPGRTSFRQIGGGPYMFKAQSDGDILGVFPDGDTAYGDNVGSIPFDVVEFGDDFSGISGGANGVTDDLQTLTVSGSGGLVPPSDTFGLAEFEIEIPVVGVLNRIDYVKLIDLEHPYANDIVASLVSPGGTEVFLVDRAAGAADYDGDYCFTEDASEEVPTTEDSQPSFTIPPGQYLPKTSLCTLAGASLAGRWRLKIRDVSKNDTGSIDGWEMRLVYARTNHDVCVEGNRTPSNAVQETFSDDQFVTLETDTTGTWPTVLPKVPEIITIVVPKTGTLVTLDVVTLDMILDEPGAIHMVLMSPSGTKVTLFHRPGFVSPPDTGNLSDFFGVFRIEDTGSSFPDSGASTGGTFGRDPGSWPGGVVPIGSYSDFVGEEIAGVWHLFIYSWGIQNSSQIYDGTSLTITYVP